MGWKDSGLNVEVIVVDMCGFGNGEYWNALAWVLAGSKTQCE